MATVVLPDTVRALYPFKSHFLTLSDGKRMHYIDEGPEDGDVLVFAHGYPTWSFEFRAVVVYFASLGYRCVAVDHIGFGLSDKPSSASYHTMRRHIHNLLELITALDLHDITLVMEDWGGALGMGYTVRHPSNVRRLVLMNTWVFQDTFSNRLHSLLRWLTKPGLGEVIFGVLQISVGIGMQQWSARRLSSTILTAYRAPFRDARSRRALVQFPRMINTTPTHASAVDMREIESRLHDLSSIPTLILWGAKNSLMSPAAAHHWKHMMPRAKGPILVPDAGHLLAEDAPDLLIEHLSAFLGHTG